MGSRGSRLTKRRISARGALPFFPPRFLPSVYALMRLGNPLYLRLVEGVSRVQVLGIDRLAGAYRRFYDREARVLLAFRHPSVHDPPVMVYLCCRALPREARRSRRPLGGPGHVHFLYGRAVLQWSGGISPTVLSP